MTNDATAQANAAEVRELTYYAINHGELYRQRTTSVLENLARKALKGAYDADKAVTAWRHVADDAAKRYSKEHGPCTFPPATRHAVAVSLRAYYTEALREKVEQRIGPAELSVSAFSYSHDTSGNPTAFYEVGARRVSKRRIQVGYSSNYYEDGALSAIDKAGHLSEFYRMDKRTLKGDRSGDYVTATWRRVKPAALK